MRKLTLGQAAALATLAGVAAAQAAHADDKAIVIGGATHTNKPTPSPRPPPVAPTRAHRLANAERQLRAQQKRDRQAARQAKGMRS